jgi:predicted transcriptional regulator
MPSDDWKKASIGKRCRGQTYQDQIKREIACDASVDRWIEKAEARRLAEQKKRRKRDKKKSKQRRR